MARLTYDVSMNLEKLICHEEGDGWGSAEPYMWVVFFRISGDDVEIVLDEIDFSTTPPTPSVKLEGAPLMQFSPGSHGNLPNHDVDAGETVPIPTAIGLFETEVKPIQFSADLQALAESLGIELPVDDMPGFVGAAVVVMEEDNVTDGGAEAGHQALNTVIQERIQEIIDTRSIENADIDQAEVDAIADSVSGAVRDAIANHQSWFQNLWAWLNSDDEIGHQVFLFNSDNLTPSAALQRRWENEGDWELTGLLTASPECPAQAVADLLEEPSSSATAKLDLDSLRHFRDRELAAHSGARRWWELVKRNKNQIVLAMMRDKEALSTMSDIMAAATILVANTESVVGEDLIEQARSFLTILSRSAVRRTRSDANRSLDMLDRIRDQTVGEALRVLDATPPARHPER